MVKANGMGRACRLAVTASACLAVGVWSAPVSEATVPSHTSQAAPAKSVLRCYATRSDPAVIVCYRLSKKAEYRHGMIVYVPILIQVPTPSNPPSVILVNSLDDIHPNE